ncbi:calcium-binding protein [Stagnihabitans tardus]|uniref:Calcium-binding protein n=1 Tax=Stagnihabitans tardus TaxID=2699202 RepID=A0AAE4Y8A1_9RHOB|nr:calcium-binding protein [Stagnihabitans tardus]NBZ86756.1 hypothetical protein [Stagnihabitans tardus]
MAIIEATTVAGFTVRGDVITMRHVGMNLAQGYERFGTLPWEKFDEVQTQIGAQLVRYPGGTEAETLFDYANPQATTAISPTGQVMQLTTPQAFLDYCRATGTQATFILATEQLLTSGAYGSRDFDASKAGLLRDYVRYILEEAGPGGVATFELGNEYAGYMNAVEYGKVASTMALIVDQEIDRYYDAHPGATRPDIAVQVWGVSAGEALSVADLFARNENVMAQFSTAELAAITATTTHFYYTEGKFLGQSNAHTYDALPGTLGGVLQMMNTWQTAAGRELDTVFSEWNVHFKDPQSFGLQQVPILLEMFQTLVTLGVDELDIWSTMYNASALADYRGALQASGALMQIMAKEVVGMKVAEVPVTSDNYDIHGFSSGAKVMLFVSSMADGTIQLSMDLQNYLDRYDLASARVIGVDASGADGVYKSYTGLAPWEEPDAPVRVTAQNLASFLSGGVYATQLGAHETLVLELNRAPIRFGSMSADNMAGRENTNDRIDAMASSDKIYGLSGDDTLFGGDGNDALWGGVGSDRLWGGLGNDDIWGGDGDDTVEGRFQSDTVRGGAGDDYVSGGDGADTLWGGIGADGFIFRAKETGTDLIRDFRATDQDFLIYQGTAGVTASNFTLERKVIAGIGGTGAELLVHWGGMNGPVLAILQDAGGLGSLMLQDGVSGAMLSLS